MKYFYLFWLRGVIVFRFFSESFLENFKVFFLKLIFIIWEVRLVFSLRIFGKFSSEKDGVFLWGRCFSLFRVGDMLILVGFKGELVFE